MRQFLFHHIFTTDFWEVKVETGIQNRLNMFEKKNTESDIQNNLDIAGFLETVVAPQINIINTGDRWDSQIEIWTETS